MPARCCTCMPRRRTSLTFTRSWREYSHAQGAVMQIILLGIMGSSAFLGPFDCSQSLPRAQHGWNWPLPQRASGDLGPAPAIPAIAMRQGSFKVGAAQSPKFSPASHLPQAVAGIQQTLPEP